MSILTRIRVRFGPFELDSSSGELFKLGHKLNLHGQPVEVLSILLERPGEVVTREELCKRLWPQDTFVDFEHSLNTAIKKLRQALDDDPDAPRYIETLPKKGYRFIAPVEAATNGAEIAADHQKDTDPLPAQTDQLSTTPSLETPRRSTRRRWIHALTSVIALALFSFVVYEFCRPRVPFVTRIRQLTRTGHIKIRNAPRYLATDGIRVYFAEILNGQGYLSQVSVNGGDVSYIDLPTVKSPHVRDISANGSDLLLVDWGINTPDQPWVVSLPDGPALKTPFTTNFAFSFLPGDKQVLYADTNHLFTANLDGTSAHQVLTAPFPLMAAVPSPDGQRVRYVMTGHIWECRMDGTGVHPFLPQWSQPVGSIRWSPDGKTFVLQSRDADGPNLWAVSERTFGPLRFASQPTRLTSGPLAFRAWALTKDGKHMYAIGESRRGELSVYDPKSGVFSPYLGGISAALTDFSRDGQWVAYVTYPEGAVWRSRVDGSQRLRLTMPTPDLIINPKWSPDGRFIAYSSWEASYVWESGEFSHKIYLVPADGGAPMLLLAGKFNPGDPNWSPDGKSLVYGGSASSVFADLPGATLGEEESEIRIFDIETRQSRTIPGSKRLFSPRWSPDGRFIAAIAPVTGALWLYTLESEQWKELPISKWREPGMGWISFSHDSQYIYGMTDTVFRVRLPNGPTEMVVDLSGIHITDPALWGGWFGLTPDDRVIVLRDLGLDEVYALDLEYR